MSRSSTKARLVALGLSFAVTLVVKPGPSSAADDAAPAPPKDQATPEAAYRAFYVALAAGDEATLKRVTIPVDGFELLLRGPHARKESVESIRKFMDSVSFARAKPGDRFHLPDGKVVTIKPEQVTADRAVIVIEGSPVPADMHRVKGAWKVDPSPSIALRRRNPSGPARPGPNLTKKAKKDDGKEKEDKKDEEPKKDAEKGKGN